MSDYYLTAVYLFSIRAQFCKLINLRGTISIYDQWITSNASLFHSARMKLSLYASFSSICVTHSWTCERCRCPFPSLFSYPQEKCSEKNNSVCYKEERESKVGWSRRRQRAERGTRKKDEKAHVVARVTRRPPPPPHSSRRISWHEGPRGLGD